MRDSCKWSKYLANSSKTIDRIYSLRWPHLCAMRDPVKLSWAHPRSVVWTAECSTWHLQYSKGKCMMILWWYYEDIHIAIFRFGVYKKKDFTEEPSEKKGGEKYLLKNGHSDIVEQEHKYLTYENCHIFLCKLVWCMDKGLLPRFRQNEEKHFFPIHRQFELVIYKASYEIWITVILCVGPTM